MRTLEIHNMPDELYRLLCERAAAAGLPVSDFALGELVGAAETPTVEEVLKRAGNRAGCGVTAVDAVTAVRSGRDETEIWITPRRLWAEVGG